MEPILKDEFKGISDSIITWYEANKRDLPWRHTRNPYKIWLSEIMLQQTRVEQGLSYYLKFVKNYPQITDLANASEEQVLRDWQGLGYYSRARNLHETAKIIRDNYQGIFPQKYEDIKTLKGVGDYTAAAIASFAFDLPYAVVDGNVFRVLSRIFGIETDISSSGAKKEFTEMAQRLLNNQNPAIHNQAMMEFGALHCTPKKPSCNTCPLNKVCFAKRLNKQDELPVKLKKTKVSNRYFNYLIIRKEASLSLQKRKDKDIWSSLYEFPLIETDEVVSSASIVSVFEEGVVENIKKITETRHILSHQRLYCSFWEVVFRDKNYGDYAYFDIEEIKALPKPVLINNFLLQFYF